MKSAILLLLLILPLTALAETGKKQEGFFDSSVTETGFFSDDQAGIPIKNPGGNVTRKSSDSWELNEPNPQIPVGTKEMHGEGNRIIIQTGQSGRISGGRSDSFEIKTQRH